MQIRARDAHIARVLFEDEEYITIEVHKDRDTEIQVAEDDKYLTLMFLRLESEETAKVYTPWRPNDEY